MNHVLAFGASALCFLTSIAAAATPQDYRFKANFAESKSVTARTSSGGSGGKIELRVGSPTGALLATIDVPVTGGWDKWQEGTSPLKRIDGGADVYAVLTNAGKGGLMNIDWVQFNP